MAGELTIGIDVGTTSVKAGLIDPSGTLIDHYSSAYPTFRSDGARVEQNGDDWTIAIDAALDKFSARLGDVAAIGLCSQANTHIFVGADGAPLERAIVWQDGRASAEAQELDARVSTAQRMVWWGAPMPIDASHALARMLWVQRNRPDIWEKTKYVMLPKDYCLFKLTGEAATDALSNIGLVSEKLHYIPDVLDLVPGAADRAVPIQPIRALVGTVQSGPASGIPVANCTMDAWTGLLGSGCHRDGATSYLSGTSEILGINSASVTPTAGIIVFPACEGVRIHAGPTQAGGAAKLWFAKLTGQSPQEMSRQAGQSDFTRPAPIFVPHLQGERAPIWKSHTRGMFLGLDQRTSAADLARSVYEGVAYSARLLLETLEQSSGIINPTITCGGGGFQSDVWNQIRANVLGRSLRRLAVKDPGILGAAGIAAFAADLHGSLDVAFEQITCFDAVYEPEVQTQDTYDALYRIYVDAIDANEALNQAFLDAAGPGESGS